MTLSLCSLLSSGKDSNYALLWAVTHGFRLRCIATFESRSRESWMLQTINTELARLQAESIGVPHYSYEVSGLKELEVDEIKNALDSIVSREEVEYVTTGALRSDYQRIRFERVFNELSLKPVNPLWWVDQPRYMRLLARSGLEFVITRISAYGLPPGLLGRIVGPEEVEVIVKASMVYGFNPAFEGGEAETLVVYSPLYRKRICFKAKKSIRGDVAELDIIDYWLSDPGDSGCYVVI